MARGERYVMTTGVKPQGNHMTITTHEQAPRLGRGKHETFNLVMARCREGAGYCRGSFFSL